MIMLCREKNVQKDTMEQASINKNNAALASYNYFPIYSRSFRVKSSSTNEFDGHYNGADYYSSEDTSQNHYGIRMTYPNHLEHGAEV